jgi:peptide/nickel transport system substrate-binding protein
MMKSKTKWYLVGVAVVIIAILSSYVLYDTFLKPPPPPQRLVISKIAEADSLDPAVSGMIEGGRVYEVIFDSYFAYDMSGQMQPWLAESYQWSPDGKILTLNLRKDVKFHNGDPFNATAVKYSIERILDPTTKSPAAATVAEVSKVEVTDTYTAKIYLKAPNRFFLDTLAGGAAGSPVCPSVAKKLGKDFGTTNPVGTGPFIFKEWRRDDRIVLVKNKNYNWAPAFTKHTGPALLDEIVFKVIPEDTTRAADLRTPEGANMATRVPENQVGNLRQDPNLKILTAPEGRVLFLSMNLERMTDARIRQAVAHAIDRDAINKAVYFNLYQPAYSPLQSTLPPFYEDMEKTGKARLYDTKKSAALLDDAGWKLGADGYRYKEGKILELTAVQYINIEAMIVVQDQLKKVGIKMNLVEFRGDRQGWYSRLTASTFDMTMASWQSNTPALEWFFFSGQIPWPNWVRFSSTDFETLVNTGKTDPDQNKAIAAYYKAQEMIIDQAVWAPLFYSQNIVGIRKNVLNYNLPPRTGSWMYLDVTVATS